MICRECPVRKSCPKEQGKNCCFGTYMEPCEKIHLCHVRTMCEVFTYAGEAVAIWEEVNPNINGCFGDGTCRRVRCSYTTECIAAEEDTAMQDAVYIIEEAE